MNLIRQYGGVALIIIGALLLFTDYMSWLTGNTVLLTGLFLIILGIILYVWMQKRAGKY